MNYELAKELDRTIDYPLAVELKNAGFPQKQGEAYLMGENHEIVYDLAPYRPTLSELIEACGEKFYQLTDMGIGWTAIDNVERWHRGDGKTPEEAVARLWLALNKKNLP